ncbi:GAF domain-containing protein [Porifericola rhodea]|uniref:GAF domain-containing protein n=1 Tax=Porifericola rhodea TaxID=930972 RepID=UPI00266566EA|nr:GAF domain-containing protein [Porifericola rhodea]WKN32574.1 GAF domain-containing protein [Porifericola rhodea]
MVILENVTTPTDQTKQQKYKMLFQQIRDIVSKEEDLTANLGNIAAVVHYTMEFDWTGFYKVKNGELVLGPFQGPAAVSRIALGEGVCGTAYAKECTIVVDDVEQFVGYVPCSELDKSEISLPAFHKGEVALIFNINSHKMKNFDDTDRRYLEELMHLLEEIL